eukprot:TRINITY_DN3759_c0_g2_i1.p2 TRINITY_DN3759_c0_g2~~TRINITY_DN3759_c0_g2_i1.p2  ORF type:complete len:110 (-),score=2.12 TRINITY_DN3759_c0_g2_i1:61-390(-)
MDDVLVTSIDDDLLEQIRRRDKALDDAVAFYESELNDLRNSHALEKADLLGRIHALEAALSTHASDSPLHRRHAARSRSPSSDNSTDGDHPTRGRQGTRRTFRNSPRRW